MKKKPKNYDDISKSPTQFSGTVLNKAFLDV